MPLIKAQAYEMDRRQLLKMTGTMGIGAAFVMPHELYAAELCDKISISNGTVNAEQAGATLQFWIDGMHFPKSDVKSRANITLFMDLKQSAVSHVESVVLMDSNKRTMGARFFDSSMKMSSGHVPYVRFDNLELDATKDYHVVYTVKSGSTVKLYAAVVSKPEVSRINTTWLPQKMRNDFTNFLLGNQANPTPGLITNQFQFYTKNGLEAHCARGKMMSMSSDGSFSCNIAFMHGDAGANHYMRYFIVMDPVGRILGFKKRTFGDGLSGSVDVGKLDNALKTEYSIPDLQVANINDCPYVQVYTEDSYDAVARNLLRLR
jgi:hypothetical protein